MVGWEHLKILETDGWKSVEEFSVDWRKKFFGKPLAVCFPGSVKELQKIVALAAETEVKLVPQGGNTGLSGGATPDSSMEQVVVCLNRMNNIQATDFKNRSITLQAGCTLRELQLAAEGLGLFFPLDFTSRDGRAFSSAASKASRGFSEFTLLANFSSA